MCRSRVCLDGVTKLCWAVLLAGAVGLWVGLAPAQADDGRVCTGGTTPGPASGNDVHPDCEDGNPTCGDLACGGDFETRINNPVSGTFPLVGGGTVTVVVVQTDDGPTFDWTSTRPMACVFVKGGPNGNRFFYGEPGENSDTGLHSPINPSNGKFYGLSHISFCSFDICRITVVKRSTAFPDPGDSPNCGTDGGVVPDWPIRVYDGDTLIAEECTDAAGVATFEVACHVEYTIREVVPVFLPGAGGDFAIFEGRPIEAFLACPDLTLVENGPPAAVTCAPTGNLWGLTNAIITRIDEFELPAEDVDDDANFELKNGPNGPECTVQGSLFCDDDGDCIIDAGEGPITAAGFGVIGTITTSPDAGRVGADLGCVLLAGQYTCNNDLGATETADIVVTVPPGWTSTCEPILGGIVTRIVTGTDDETCSADFGFIPDLECPDDIEVCTDADTCAAEVCFPEPTPQCGTPVCTATAPDGTDIPLVCEGGECCGTFPGPDDAQDSCPVVSTVTCVNTAGDTTSENDCSFTVSVEDCQDPMITCDSGPHDLGCNPTPPTCVDALAKVTASSDNCGLEPLECVAGAVGGDACDKTQRFTITARDFCDNTASCDVNFKWVEDTTPPVIDCSAEGVDVDEECDGEVTLSATVTDNCCINAGDVSATPVLLTGNATLGTPACTATQVDSKTVQLECTVSVSDLTSCPATVRWDITATDCCENTSTDRTCTADVNDVTKPVIDCPDDQAIACDEETDIPVTASDNCDPNVVPVCDLVAESFPGLAIWSPLAGGGVKVRLPFSGSATFECTVTDACGNAAVPCVFTVTAECLECRVTGGGNDGKIPPKSFADGESGGNAYTFGGQAGAPTAAQPQPWGEWTHRQHRGPAGKFTFHAGTASAPAGTEIDLIECSDPLSCHPARPAPAKQIDFEGVGSFKNGKNLPAGDDGGDDLNWFSVHIEDLGEPGNQSLTDLDNAGLCPPGGHAGLADGCDKCACADYYRIKIHASSNPGSAVIYEVGAYIHGGNFQIHPPVGESYHGATCP